MVPQRHGQFQKVNPVVIRNKQTVVANLPNVWHRNFDIGIVDEIDARNQDIVETSDNLVGWEVVVEIPPCEGDDLV